MTDPDPGNPAERRTIKVDYRARVEGEGALHLEVRDGTVEDVKLKISGPSMAMPRRSDAKVKSTSVPHD